MVKGGLHSYLLTFRKRQNIAELLLSIPRKSCCRDIEGYSYPRPI
jgi:hypothetical protein